MSEDEVDFKAEVPKRFPPRDASPGVAVAVLRPFWKSRANRMLRGPSALPAATLPCKQGAQVEACCGMGRCASASGTERRLRRAGARSACLEAGSTIICAALYLMGPSRTCWLWSDAHMNLYSILQLNTFQALLPPFSMLLQMQASL